MPNTPNSVVTLDQFGRLPALGSGIAGVTDGSDARPGSVGEFMQAVRELGGGGLVGNATPSTITDFVLSPGDWDVWGTFGISMAAGITASAIVAGVSTTANTFEDISSNGLLFNGMALVSICAFPITPVRFSLPANTTVYLIGQVNSSSGGSSAVFGSISARRVR